MSAVPVRTREPRRRPRLRVVQPQPPRNTLRFVVLTLLLGAASVFGAVALNALAAGDAVAARELETHVAAQERRYAELVVAVAELEDPGRIRQVAIERLGMIPARSPRFLHVLRPLAADGYVADLDPVGGATDPLKPVLSAQR